MCDKNVIKDDNDQRNNDEDREERFGRDGRFEGDGVGMFCSFLLRLCSDVAKDSSLRMRVGVMSVREIEGIWRRKQG